MRPTLRPQAALCALIACSAVGALGVPTTAGAEPADALPTPQAIAANAEFLARLPAPPSGPGRVCVIDTGVTPLPDMAGRVVERLAIDGGSPDDVDHVPGNPRSGHGSFVAGVIASQRDGRGSAGIWPAAEIVSVRVFRSADAGATPHEYMNAISECGHPGRGVRVITISIGGGVGDYEMSKLEDRIADTHSNRSINVVAAAGNEGDQAAVGFPARFEASLAVGAADPAGRYCGFSNRGAGLDVATLGCDLAGTAFDGSRQPLAGTSYAAPTVAAVLLALRAHRPDLSAGEAERILVAGSGLAGAGRVVDAERAFTLAGLGHLVEEYRPVSASADAPATREGAGGRRLARPRLLSASHRRGIVRIRVALSTRRGARAVFRVGGRPHVRPGGLLRLRSPRWPSVSVFSEDAAGRRSPSLRIRRPKVR